MRLPALELVAAMAANRVIGRGNALPWHLPDDLKHFKKLTMGHPVVMGRRTFESVGKPLPGRRSIVVSNTLKEPPVAGIEVVRSLDEARRLVAETSPTLFVVGGAVLYEKALPLATTLELTELDEAVDGDTYFPSFDKRTWQVVSEIRHERDDRHKTGFWFRKYQNVILSA